MKIIFDFDGVLTTQIAEARRVEAIFIEMIRKFSGLEKKACDTLLQRALHEVKSFPFQHGWKHEGRLAAYANEDLFIHNVALSFCLEELADTQGGDFAQARQNLLRENFSSFYDMSQKAYEQMTKETRADAAHNPMDPYVKELLEALLTKGHNITLVSNSLTDRIVDLLQKIGLHLDRFQGGSTGILQVRGNAKKFHLAPEKSGFQVGNYWVDTARPNFEKIIREERPDLMVGDVLSLDLALPYALTQNEPKTFGQMRLVLREQPYTPEWSKTFFLKQKEKNPSLFYVIHDLRQFSKIISC